MDLSYSEEELAFQADVRQWLKDRLPPELAPIGRLLQRGTGSVRIADR